MGQEPAFAVLGQHAIAHVQLTAVGAQDSGHGRCIPGRRVQRDVQINPHSVARPGPVHLDHFVAGRDLEIARDRLRDRGANGVFPRANGGQLDPQSLVFGLDLLGARAPLHPQNRIQQLAAAKILVELQVRRLRRRRTVQGHESFQQAQNGRQRARRQAERPARPPTPGRFFSPSECEGGSWGAGTVAGWRR